MEGVRRFCGFLNGIDVTSLGSEGGLSLGWKHKCFVTLRSFLGSHIDVLIHDDSMGNCWRCTCFYRALQEQRREESWQLLCQLNDCLDMLKGSPKKWKGLRKKYRLENGLVQKTKPI